MMKNHVFCMEADCELEYSPSVLKVVLRNSIYERLEKRRQAEEVLAAGIEGLESCPFCDYCQVPPEGDRLFECRNPDCMTVSCRHCRQVSHLPWKCEEATVHFRSENDGRSSSPMPEVSAEIDQIGRMQQDKLPLRSENLLYMPKTYQRLRAF